MDQRYALQPAEGHRQTDRQAAAQARRGRADERPVYRAFLLYGELRYIYRLPYHEAVERLEAWLAWASRSA